jgi:hypothetical protein
MSQKCRIYKDREQDTWVASRPRLGFAGPEQYAAPTYSAALQWLQRADCRQGSLAGQTERFTASRGMSVQATATDGRPRWR